jgi:hypothetical protein
MLFALRYEPREVSEEKEKRSVTLFTHWKPPAGYEFKSHYAFADGNGGMAIVEAASTAAIVEAHAPWGPFFHFKITRSSKSKRRFRCSSVFRHGGTRS